MKSRRDILLSLTVGSEYQPYLLELSSQNIDRMPYTGEDNELILMRSFDWSLVGPNTGDDAKWQNYVFWKRLAVELNHTM